MRMRVLPVLKIFLLFSFSLFLVLSRKALAQLPPPVTNSLTVSTYVEDTTVIFQGYASPGAHVLFIRDDAVVGTTTATQSGYFEKKIGALSPNINVIKIYATDRKGERTSSIKFSINLIGHTDTTVRDVILPPSIDIEKSKVNPGEKVRIRGITVPNAEVRIFLFDNKQSKTTRADSDGNWTISFTANSIPPGRYKIYAKTIYDGMTTSESWKIALEVLDDGSFTVEDSDKNISVKNEDLPVELICDLPNYFTTYDSDSTCHINYNEFLILVKEWYDGWRDKDNCDVNYDAVCDLKDFSVVLYYVDR